MLHRAAALPTARPSRRARHSGERGAETLEYIGLGAVVAALMAGASTLVGHEGVAQFVVDAIKSHFDQFSGH